MLQKVQIQETFDTSLIFVVSKFSGNSKLSKMEEIPKLQKGDN
jgi:hypothetical protein